MGLYPSGISPEQVDIAAIAAAMRPALYAWMNCRLIGYDPNTSTTTPYNALTDEGGKTTLDIVFDSGPDGAIVQPIRSPTAVTFGSQATNIEGIRFQTKRDFPTAALRSGLRFFVPDGGEASELSRYVFSLSDGIDSSLAWGRILEAQVELGSIPPTIPEPVAAAYGEGLYGVGNYGG